MQEVIIAPRVTEDRSVVQAGDLRNSFGNIRLCLSKRKI